MDNILKQIKGLVSGKQIDTKALSYHLKAELAKGYFELRKKYSGDAVNSLLETQKILARWEGHESQKAYLHHHYNKMSPDKLDLYGDIATFTQSRESFDPMIGALIGAGIPGDQLDEFENWLDDDSRTKGDGYRFMTPTKNVYGEVVLIETTPKEWRVQMYGIKPIIKEIKRGLE